MATFEANKYIETSEEEDLILQTAREFAENEIAPRALEIDATNEYPLDLAKRMGELGFYHLTFPEAMGGGGHGPVIEWLIQEEFAKVSPGLGAALGWGLSSATYLVGLAPKLVDKYLDGALAGTVRYTFTGSDPVGSFNHTEESVLGTKVADGWVLNGTRVFGSFAGVAKVHFPSGKGSDGAEHLWYLDAETPGVKVEKIDRKLGGAGLANATVSYEDVFVPDDQLSPFPSGSGPDRDGNQTGYIPACACCVGGAQGILSKTVDYMKERTTHGEPLANMSVIADRLAQFATQVEVAQCFFHRAIDAYRSTPGGKPHASMLKVYCADMFATVARGCIELWGGLGVYEEVGVARYLRDAITFLPADRPATAHYQQIAQSVLGLGVTKTLAS
jgi:alkylation response protein AidB-like acyl-CoA dehydrogenase